MYCSACKFTTFDHPSACPKCGVDWLSAKEKLNLGWITTQGYDWLAEGGTFHAAEPLETDGVAMDTIDPSFMEDQVTVDAPGSGLQELSFDDFEEVSIGESDNELFALKKTGFKESSPAPVIDHGDQGMPEIEMQETDLGGTLLSQEIDDLAGMDLNLDELTETTPGAGGMSGHQMETGDLSLDDLDLELEDLVKEAGRSKTS
jgi:hypothetical protein